MPRLRLAVPLSLFVLAAILSSCGKSDEIKVNTDFSVNLGAPIGDWPSKQSLTPVQKETLARYGPPTFLRLFWDKTGEYQTLMQMDKLLREKKINEIKHTWLYPARNLEIVFDDPKTCRELPLDDQLRLITDLGDPEERRINQAYKDGVEEWWTYYSRGETYIFRDKKLAEKKKDFAPMGKIIRR